jgi:hypothetical protein
MPRRQVWRISTKKMIQPRPSHPLSLFRINIVPLGLICSACMLIVFFPDQVSAEVRTVTAQGEYRLSDRDTKEDGIQLAAEQAKRNALEQVASYLESITVARDLDVTQDEIRSYTAGVVVVLDQHIAVRLDDQTVVVQVTLTARVDTDEVVQALAAVKQHEEARHELLALQQELDRLHLELDAANQALGAATTSEQARESSNRREELLTQVQSNAMVAQAWTNWLVLGSLAYPYAWSSGLPQIQALISVAGQLNPNNPHLHAVQQAVANQPPAPPRPPTAPVPHTVPFLPRMPTYQVVPRPPAPPESPGDRSADPSIGSPPAHRRLESIYQLNPLLPPPSTVPSSVVQQYMPPPSQPPTLYTWPQTQHSRDPHATLHQGTAPPSAKVFNSSKSLSQHQSAPVTSPRNYSSHGRQFQQPIQQSGHMSSGASNGGGK